MLNAEGWEGVGKILIRELHALVAQKSFALPLIITICELDDPERILMELIWPAEDKEFELGLLCPMADELKANWPLLIRIEGSAGNSVEYSLEPQKRS